MLGLLCILLIGNTAYAAEDFFWSEIEPKPSCTQNSSGTPGSVGLIIGDEEVELPTCEEAMNSRVLVLVNGEYLHTVLGAGTEPFIEKGRTMVPLRALADAFDFEVEWVGEEQKITLTKGNSTILLYIGSPEIVVDGETVYFEGAVPMIKNRRTFLPASKLAEILGIQVSWDGEKRTATFTSE